MLNSVTPTGDFAFTDQTCGTLPYSIGPGTSCYGNVTFTPTATGARTGKLTVASSGGNQTVTLTGTGEMATQAIAFTPATTLNFGSIPNGTQSYVSTVWVRNTGTAPVTFSGPATVTGNYAIFDSCTSQTLSLAGGASCYISLSFTPNGTGVQTGTLTLTDSAGTGTQTLALTGTGIAATAVVDINAPSYAFDQQPVQSSASYAIYYLYNYGTSQVITIASVAITAGGANYSLGPGDPDSCSNNSVGPGGYCYVYVGFNPTMPGYLTGALTFTDTAGKTYAGALSGYSEPATESAVLTPTGVNFGDSAVGITVGGSSYPVTLTNTGDEPLTVGTISGTNYGTSGEFMLSNLYGDGCSGQPVGGGGACTLYLQFTPSAAGSRTGTVVFPVTYAGATAPVNLTATLAGTGVADKNSAILTPSAVTFIDQVVGTTMTNYGVAITLENTGNLALSVGSVVGSNYGSNSEFQTFNNNPAGYDGCSNQPVPAGGSCSITLQFTPSATGSRTGTMVFPVTYSGATTAVNLTATLSGKGIAQVNSAVLSPTALNFGPVARGTTEGGSQNYSIVLTNMGNLPFNIGTLTGTN